MLFHSIPSKDLQGVDVSKEITLKEYGFAYHVLPRKGIYRFYIGQSHAIDHNSDWDSHDYTWFECLELPLDVAIEVEFDFINVLDVASCCGLTSEEWLETSAPRKLYDAINYYSPDNF
mgnify:FL=1|tara:strand:- start:1722 stop:2075 length:354 start_codon:yes stop_codon:yes gene_type:complete